MKYLLLTLLLAITFVSNAQQLTLYNFFYEYPQLQNPAYVGSDLTFTSKYSTTSIFATYRNQWAGIDGSPESVSLGINGRIPGQKLGLGFLITNDVFNIIGRTSAYANVAYGIELSENQKLRFGLSFGLVQNRIDFEKIENADLDDPAFLDGNQRSTTIDGGFGLLFTHKDIFELGVSALQLLGSQTSYANQSQEQSSTFNNSTHYLISSKTKIPMTSKVVGLHAIAGLRAIQSLKTSWELGSRVSAYDVVWLTAVYRHQAGVNTTLGVKPDEFLKFAYSFEFMTTGLGLSNTGGTHEIGVHYIF